MATNEYWLPKDEAIKRIGSILSGVRETRVQVSAERSSSGDTVLYTVPSSKALYITSAILTCESSSANKQARLVIHDGSSDVMVLAKVSSYNNGSSPVFSANFIYPIKVQSGDNVRLRAVSTSDAFGAIFGWVEFDVYHP